MKREFMEYLFKEVYFVGEKISFYSEKLRVSLLNKFEISNYDLQELEDELIELNNEEYDFKITMDFKPELPKDGYTLRIKKDKNINIYAESKRSLIYAINSLKSLICKETGIITVPILYIEDYPSFKMRGIIEGFYGQPWSHEARLNSIDFIKKYRMNIFMYAPKDDEYHRKLWRESYPQNMLNKIMEIKNKCDKNNIEFCYCISPGNDFEYSKEEDFKYLFKKLDQVIENGVNSFVLLMDDIDYSLKGINKIKFKKPGIAHSYISNKVNDYLKEKVLNYSLIMCPTEYYQNWNTEYRNDIKNNMQKGIKVFWTGYNTVAEVISNEDGNNVKEHFGHDLVLWDNYPVNDFNTKRIYLGPIVNRGAKLYGTHAGIVSNPMNQWNLSKVSLITFAHYMWNPEKYNSELSYELSIRELAGEDFYKEFKLFCENNRTSVIDYFEIEGMNNAINCKDVPFIDNYFKKLKEAIQNIKTRFPNKNLIKEAEPWIHSFDLDYELWLSIKENKENIDEKVKLCLEKENTIGSELALKIAKAWKVSAIDIELKKRSNFYD